MANVQILKVGHAYVAGTRGAKGGAPSKDSIWVVAMIANTLVKAFGRRDGTLRFKTEPKAKLNDVLAMYERKLTVPFKDQAGNAVTYTEVKDDQIETLVPGLAARLHKDYYAAQNAGKLNTNSTKKRTKKVAATVEAAPAATVEVAPVVEATAPAIAAGVTIVAE